MKKNTKNFSGHLYGTAQLLQPQATGQAHQQQLRVVIALLSIQSHDRGKKPQNGCRIENRRSLRACDELLCLCRCEWKRAATTYTVSRQRWDLLKFSFSAFRCHSNQKSAALWAIWFHVTVTWVCSWKWKPPLEDGHEFQTFSFPSYTKAWGWALSLLLWKVHHPNIRPWCHCATDSSDPCITKNSGGKARTQNKLFRCLHFCNFSALQVAIVAVFDTDVTRLYLTGNQFSDAPTVQDVCSTLLFIIINMLVCVRLASQAHPNNNSTPSVYALKPRTDFMEDRPQQLIWNLLLPEATSSSENSIITAEISCGAVWQFSFATARWMKV